MSAEFNIAGFEVLDKLGEGGMASVWKARQISLDRTVAIKVLSDRLAADAGDIDRFQTEARAAAKLKHPGIVQVYDASAEGGLYYFVMEYVAGYTVGEWVRRKGRLSEKEVLLVGECVADAMGYAWERERIIHCDIKPDNVMIDEDGTVKVADLGLARTISAMNAEEDSEDVMGTPAYISPEQAQGLPDLDCRADIYSLGATLYHMLTGKMLFEGHAQEEIMELQLTDRVPDPLDTVPGVSKGVCWLLERMLCKDRVLRESSWDEVRRDIRRVSRGLLPLGPAIPDGASTLQRSARRTVTSYQAQVRTQRVKEVTTTPLIKISVITGFALVLLMLLWQGWMRQRPVPPALPPVPAPVPPSVPEVRDTEPDVAPARDEDAVERRAREMYEHAARFERENPGDTAGALALFQRVLDETRGTRYSLMAQTALNRVNAVRAGELRDALERLTAEAEALAESGDTRGAIELARTYSGPYAEDTRRERGALVTRLSLEAQAAERAKRERGESVEVAKTHTLAAAAGHIIGQDLASALEAVEQALDGFAEVAADADWRSLRAVLAEAARIDRRILDSFSGQAGQTITVEFTTGPRQVMIEAVEDGRVRCRQVINPDRMIHSTITFGPDQLALRERLQRMGADSDPEVALAKGMLALDAEAFDHAVRFFEQTHPLLGARLVEAVGDRRSGRAEQVAETALRDLLRHCGIAVESFDAADWKRRVKAAELDAAVAAHLPLAVDLYVQTHGETAFSERAADVIEALRDRSTAGRQDADARPEQRVPARQEVRTEVVLAALREANPQASPEAFLAEDEDGICVGLKIADSRVTNLDPVAQFGGLRTFHYEGRPDSPGRIRSLRPLAGLALASIAIRYAAIRDLYELRGMPLETVDLTGSMVRDLNALRGSGVRELVVAGTQITDLMVAASLVGLESLNAGGTSVSSGAPLVDLPIRRLDLSNTRVLDFGFVRRMPDLESLTLDGCSLRSISGLVTEGLRSLSVRNTRVEDIGPVAGSGVTVLYIAGTPVRDFSPLRGLHLTHLDVAGTSIPDLEMLAGMSLRHLDISRTRIESLVPLAGMPLRSLHLSGSRVASLDPLRGMSFHTLNIRDIPARDLQVLRGAAVERLWISEVERNLDLIRSLRGLRQVNGIAVGDLWLQQGGAVRPEGRPRPGGERGSRR